ncbi:MAG: 3-deoxy-D-manno-octulosonic acid transferase [Rhodospirillaceae bacterium]|nr:3-deoxy-D-manno-octulosonic acid transferase [Rhodospirillaceae bacterium]
MLRLLYRSLTTIAGAPLRGWLNYRAARGKEIAARLPERRGIASHARPIGKLAWFHGASVGEALSLLPIVAGVRGAGWGVLVTTGTVTSAALMAERLPAGCIHQFVPLDRPAWVRAFLAHWEPDLVIWSESELWPNMLGEIGDREIPAVLLNARLSDKAFRGWRRWPGFAKSVLAAFDLVLAQSNADAERFRALGAYDVRALGNVKLAAAPLPADVTGLAALKAAIGPRPVWLAASIHPGEDAIVGRVHQALKARLPDLLTLVVPRHADKGRMMRDAMPGLRTALRSETKAAGPDVEVYIADTMGELGLFFRAAELVFMGKSLAVGGGQNPAEPALLGCALILGADMSNFREITAELTRAGAALQVGSEAAMIEALGRLLADKAARERMGAAGRAVMALHANAVKETLHALTPYLTGPKIR